jgi:hypothetical protein
LTTFLRCFLRFFQFFFRLVAGYFGNV